MAPEDALAQASFLPAVTFNGGPGCRPAREHHTPEPRVPLSRHPTPAGTGTARCIWPEAARFLGPQASSSHLQGQGPRLSPGGREGTRRPELTQAAPQRPDSRAGSWPWPWRSAAAAGGPASPRPAPARTGRSAHPAPRAPGDRRLREEGELSGHAARSRARRGRILPRGRVSVTSSPLHPLLGNVLLAHGPPFRIE